MDIRTMFALMLVVACKGDDEKKKGGDDPDVVTIEDQDGDGVMVHFLMIIPTNQNLTHHSG